MKTKPFFYQLKALSMSIIIITALSCSSSDDSGGSDSPPDEGVSYIEVTVDGVVVSKNFTITQQNTNPDDIIIAGHVNTEESNEGMIDVVSLIYTRFSEGGNYREVRMSLPAIEDEIDLGTQFPGPLSVGNPGGQRMFDMVFAFEDDDFQPYDPNNDGSDDVMSGLIPEALGVSITDYEETTSGFSTVAKIKGSFQGLGYFLAYTGPTTDPGKVYHQIHGDFQYYIPVED